MKKYLQTMRQKGAILILTALALPLFIAGTGLAVDLGNMYVHKARLQNSTDAAVIAGGYQYAENESTTDTYDKIDEYMKLNQNTNPYAIDEVKYKTYDDDSIKITLTASEEVPLYFLKVFYDNDGKGTYPVTAKSTAKLAPTGGGIPKIFEYTMIAGYNKPYDKTKDPNSPDNNAFYLVSPLIVHGKMHSNGSVYAAISNYDNYPSSIEKFTATLDSDAELWSNYRDAIADHYTDSTQTTVSPGHEHDDFSGLDANGSQLWRYYGRLADENRKGYVAEDVKSDEIDIGMYNDRSNPWTDSLKELIKSYTKQQEADPEGALKSFESQSLYVDTTFDFSYGYDSNATTYNLVSSNSSSYPGMTCYEFKHSRDDMWNANYKVIIVDGSLTVNLPSGSPSDDDDHLMFISLHGDIHINNNGPIHGYIYAPNGTVSLGGKYPIYGSIVANHIAMYGNQQVEATHKTYSTVDGSTGKTGGYTVSLSDED